MINDSSLIQIEDAYILIITHFFFTLPPTCFVLKKDQLEKQCIIVELFKLY